jgi:glycosyltransferase involved in cell wall biosynthesis
VRPRAHHSRVTEDWGSAGQALAASLRIPDALDGAARSLVPLDGAARSLVPLDGAARSLVPLSRNGSAAPSAWGRSRISVVIPAFNEAENLRWLLPQLANVHEVIVVDGESTDGTSNVVRELCPEATLIQQRPRGKGAALRAGFAAAMGDVIVMIDADGSMDPMEIDSFVALIARGFDVVKGSRHSCGGGSEDLTFMRRLGNRVFVRLANMLYGSSWSDLCYGYIAIRRSAVDQLRLHSDGFEIETEICVHAVTADLAVAEVPSYEFNRRSGVSKLHPFRDGWRVLRVLLRNRWRPRAEVARWHGISQIPAEPLGLEPADG